MKERTRIQTETATAYTVWCVRCARMPSSSHSNALLSSGAPSLILIRLMRACPLFIFSRISTRIRFVVVWCCLLPLLLFFNARALFPSSFLSGDSDGGGVAIFISFTYYSILALSSSVVARSLCCYCYCASVNVCALNA